MRKESIADAEPSRFGELRPADWKRFQKALDGNDMSVTRRLAADANIDLLLLPTLVEIGPEAKRLAAAVDECRGSEDKVAELTAELDCLLDTRPATTEDAKSVSSRIAEIRRELQTAKIHESDFEAAEGGLAALQTAFAELFTGEPGEALHSGSQLPASIRNLLHENGFDSQRLFHEPWRTAYRRRGEPKRGLTRRLVARA